MKKTGIKKSLQFIPLLGVVLLFGVSISTSQEDQTESSLALPQADLTFAVFGDIHEDTEHLQEALNDL